jgi:hypothetical protein
MASYVPGTNSSAMENASPLAFIFCGNELIVQCTANTDDQAAAVNILSVALENYRLV